jgi:hypothetical protein
MRELDGVHRGDVQVAIGDPPDRAPARYVELT